MAISLLAGLSPAAVLFGAEPGLEKGTIEGKIRSSIVSVQVQKPVSVREPGQALRQVLLNGVLVDAPVRPNVVRMFRSNGVAYDPQGHILAYVGNKWLALNPRDAGIKIEIVRGDGLTAEAKLVGLDQRNGVAVFVAASDQPSPSRPVRAAVVLSETTQSVMDCFLVDLESRDSLRTARITRMMDAQGEPEYFLPSQGRQDQGQLVFNAQGEFWGFVIGLEPGAAPNSNVPAAPARQFLSSVSKLIAERQDVESGWLGVYIDEQPAGPEGKNIVVKEVVPGSPAATAGLLPGDTLVRFEGAPIRNAPDFSRRVRWSAVGSRPRLEILRRGEFRNLPVEIAARRDAPDLYPSSYYLHFAPGLGESAVSLIELREVKPRLGSMGEGTAPGSPRRVPLGIVGDDLTPQLGEFFGVAGGKGVLVVSVNPASLAGRYGMKAGDVIIGLNGETIANQLDFSEVLNRRTEDAVWNFQLVRGQKAILLKVVQKSTVPGSEK